MSNRAAEPKTKNVTPLPVTRARPADNALSEADWVSAGADALAEAGVGGIRIPALCEHLGVTKGSFYWHFKSLGDLLARILDFWRQKTTFDIIDRLTGNTIDPASAIGALLRHPRRSRSSRATGLEPAIRDWARRDLGAARAVGEIDKQRLLFFERMLGGTNASNETKKVRAYLGYCMMMGDSILRQTIEDAPDNEHYIVEALAMLGLASVEDDAKGSDCPASAPMAQI